MSTMVLAKKLRARQKELKAERAKVVAAYERAFEKWKRDVAAFVKNEVPSRVATVKRGDFSGYSRCCSGLPEHVFRDIPKRPTLPDDPSKEIAKTLRFIAITGQQKMQVSERDLKSWFGGLGDADDDE